MGTLYRKAVTKALPADAEILTCKRKRFARFDKADVLAEYLELGLVKQRKAK